MRAATRDYLFLILVAAAVLVLLILDLLWTWTGSKYLILYWVSSFDEVAIAICLGFGMVLFPRQMLAWAIRTFGYFETRLFKRKRTAPPGPSDVRSLAADGRISIMGLMLIAYGLVVGFATVRNIGLRPQCLFMPCDLVPIP